jgi:hypothetical protein
MIDGPHERSAEPDIATTTLAEIYVQQGLVDRALAIYRRLAQRSPADTRLAARVTELETELERQRAGGELATVVDSHVLAAGEVSAPAGVAESPGGEAVSEPRPRPSAPPVAEDHRFLAWLEKR